MATIHYLNVKEGDCSVIQHNSERVTVIDVCNAKIESPVEQALGLFGFGLSGQGTAGIHRQKDNPVNPISYMQAHGIKSVFRFILTNPDMDHMDGIQAFFTTFTPLNFWDTDNNADKDFSEGSPYSEADWRFYKALRDGKPEYDPKRLTLYSGDKGKFRNIDENEQPGGDGLYVLAPTPALVREANEIDDHNDCSYVVLYKTGGWRILFGGDSHDRTWEHVLSVHKQDVENLDLLIAPHDGRDSDRSYEFLDVLKPKLTFFGNARSEHLAYDAWYARDLPFITNNQAGSMVIDASGDSLSLYVTHKPFAQSWNQNTFYSEKFRAYYCYRLA